MEHQEEGVRVGPAGTGLGVFATRRFLPAETVGRVHGTIIADPKHESEYCIELGRDSVLEPRKPFRCLNHSCRPNCALVQVETEDEEGSFAGVETWVEALSEIRPGDELTIDYAWPADVAIPCRCGSSDCRGWIVDREELDRLAVHR